MRHDVGLADAGLPLRSADTTKPSVATRRPSLYTLVAWKSASVSKTTRFERRAGATAPRRANR